jgi:putative two-component system response regulator
MMSMLTEARILIVDDEPPNVLLLERILERAGYTNLRGITDSREALAAFAAFNPDIVLLDLHMPHLDGFAVMSALQPALANGGYLPILVLTADVSAETKGRALSRGAKDFVVKPFEQTEVLLRIANLLETRRLHLRLQVHNELLEQQVRERTRDLEEARLEILQRLALAAEYRDDDTHEHTQRVGDVSALIALELGLGRPQAETLRQAAPLHDLGKIGVSDSILLKPGKLSAVEFETVKLHTEIGALILSGSRFPILQMGEVIARTHHERWDGTGYGGLKGEEIPLPSRIVAVADVFDALTHERPYKRAWPWNEAVTHIREQMAAHFDPLVVKAFVHLEERGALLSLEAVPPEPAGQRS